MALKGICLVEVDYFIPEYSSYVEEDFGWEEKERGKEMSLCHN